MVDVLFNYGSREGARLENKVYLYQNEHFRMEITNKPIGRKTIDVSDDMTLSRTYV
jgi:hypothetical protein